MRSVRARASAATTLERAGSGASLPPELAGTGPRDDGHAPAGHPSVEIPHRFEHERAPSPRQRAIDLLQSYEASCSIGPVSHEPAHGPITLDVPGGLLLNRRQRHLVCLIIVVRFLFPRRQLERTSGFSHHDYLLCMCASHIYSREAANNQPASQCLRAMAFSTWPGSSPAVR